MKPKPNKPSSSNKPLRCQRRTLNGQCTLCYDHARLALEARQHADFSKFLTKEAAGFQTASGINCALGDLYVLLAQGHITPRRAAVLANICSLLLRTFPAIENDPSPDADRHLIPYVSPDSFVQEQQQARSATPTSPAPCPNKKPAPKAEVVAQVRQEPIPPGKEPLPDTIDGYIDAVTKLKLNQN